MKNKLAFTNCKKCKKIYLIGINGKDITQSQTSGGKTYFAIGNDEIEKAPKIKKKMPCKNCGEICEVKEK